MTSLKIIGLCVAAAMVYGILHDQVTARVCVEYFTIGHPAIFRTESPTLLAIGWGVVATWWVGLFLGVGLALAARAGGRARLEIPDLLRPIAVLLASMGAISLVAGLAGYFASRAGWVWLVDPLASRVPVEKHSRFLADLWAHNAAYAAGFLGGLLVCFLVLRQRYRTSSPQSRRADANPLPPGQQPSGE